MTNRDLYFRDPTTLELLNNGVSKVSEIGHDAGQIKTLRFELQNFVCDGEYARGMERISRLTWLAWEKPSRTPSGSAASSAAANPISSKCCVISGRTITLRWRHCPLAGNAAD